jgi:hypothetical protein
MSFDEITQEVFEQNECIKELEQQISKLINRIDAIRYETSKRKYDLTSKKWTYPKSRSSKNLGGMSL